MEAARTPSRALLGVALFLGLFSVSGSSQSSWTSIAPMPVPRYGHAAVELAGLIHVLGGSNASDCSALTSHDVYDPVANTWVARAAMTSNRSNLAAAVLNDGTRNRLYAVGGSTGCSTRTPSMEAYDPVTDTWTPMAPMPGGERSAMAAGVVNGIMYVAGGVDAGEALSRRFESYNPLTNTWTTLPQLPYTRYMMSAGVLNGRLYLVGGGSATAALVNVDVYDPATGTWSAAASLPVARFGAGSVVANGRLYVVGGSDPAGFVASGTVYDPAANAWSPLAVLPTARGYAPLAAANGRLMLFGGYDATSAGLTSSLALATDSIPPATTATPSVTPNGNGWNNSDVGITLSAADDAGGSGVQSLTYALTGAQTGGGTSASSAAFTITSEGTTTVTYHATDVAGNVEPAHTLVVRIDKTAPVLGALANIVTTATSSAGAVVTFAIPASDGLSGVASTSASPKQSGSTFAPGTTHESVTVLDFAGNSAAGGFDVIVNPGRPVVTLSGGTFNANGAPHPAVASVTDGTGNPVAGTVNIQYVPGGASAPVTAGQYTATASFTSGDPAFTNVIPWAAMAPDPHAKSEPAAAEINGLIYVFGFDQDPNGTQSSFVPRLSIYNPQTNQWSIGASPSQVRAFASVGVLGGKLYVAGGCIMSDCRIGTTTLVEIYDPATNSWSVGPSLQTARFSAAAGVIGGKFYVAGGTSACPPCAEVTTTEVYDPATHLWSFVAPIPQSRDLEIGAVVNGELYVIGGSKASVPSSRVDVYNPVTNAWSSKAPMPTARSGAAAGVINGRIYVAGGTGAALLNTTESYDPVSNTWSEQSSLPTARGYAAGAVANSKLYVFDGVTSVPLNVVEAYDPANDVTASITILPAALAPPTLAVAPLTAVKGTGSNFTFSGTGAPGATVSLYDGSSQFQGGILVDASGNWSNLTAVDNFLVGSHAMTATQSSGAQTSSASAAVSVHVRPPAPGINFLNNIVSPTSPASVTVTGFGFYGGGQTPPTGATVTIFEGQTVLGTALVPSSGPWSTVISLPYGSHALTASQTLAGETSDLSAPSTVTVSQPIGPPTLSASPTTVVSGNSITLSGSGAAGASVSLFDGASNIGGGIPVNGTGNWSTTRSFVVGSHVLTATQSLSNQTSGASAPVTVHVRPQAPNISSPASVTSATSPAGVALNGSGFYGSSQTPPTGSTVTVFEGATVRGTAVVTSAGQWSTTVQLAYGSHTLRASQALAGETSDLSGSVTATVNPALVSISVQPSTASMNIGDSQPFQADGLFSDGTHKMLPTSGSGSTGGTGGVVPSNSAWQVNFTPSLNVSACAQVPGGFSSQAFAPGNTGTVSTTWGSGSIIQVNGTMTLQTVDLTLTCNPDNGSTPGALHATWTGTRFEGTVTFSGSTSSVVITGWSTKAPMPTPRFAFVAATVNGIVYAMGRDNPSLVSPVEAYNPATDTWTTIGQMPVSLSGPAAAALNNKIYVAGGNVSGGNATTGFYVYDPAANTWATLPSMPTGRSHLALAAAGGKLYAIGGDTAVVNGQNTGQVAVVESFDPATNQWTTRAPMLAPRNFHVAGALNNDSMIVVAGLSSNGTTSTELYDVATNTWTAGPAMLSSVSGMASAVVSNALFVFGGFGSNGPLNLAHMFRPAAGQQAAGWAALAGMPTARNSLAAASVGDVIYAIGGQVNNLGTSTLEAFSAAPPSNFSVTSGTGSGGSGGSGGATLPVVQWQSSNPSVATIDSSGFAHGSAAGNTTIIATANGISCATTSSCGTLTVIEPADITFTLAPGSAPFTSVQVAVSDPATGEPFGSFELPIGQAQSVDPSAYRLAFTAPAGYTVTPSQIDVTVQAGQHVTVPLLFAPVDTPAPTLTLLGASPMTVEAGSSFVDPGATASDASGGSLTAQIQITGTVNPSVVGAYTLTYSVSDGLHTTTATRTVNVVDTTRPMITAPANVTAEATGPGGATVNPGQATGTDLVGPVTITRTPADNLFALGSTTITWRATDGAGNFSEAPQQVTVVDTTGPSVTVPANIVAEATSAGGAVVTFSVSATDLVDGSTSVTCAPASGSTFAFGTSTVQCTSHDTRLNPGTGSFTVTVNDTLPPVVSVLTPLAEDVVATAPATVTVDVQVVDAGGAAAVTINGVSATNVGTTAQGTRWRAAVPGPAVGTALTITATATDRGGRQGSVSIVVDNDGIEGAIDRGRTSNADMSGAYSSEFNDGTTAGTIQRLTNTTVVTAVRSGGAIRLTLAGAGSAQISVCTGNVKYVVLDSPGESADVSCAATGTVTVTGRGAGSVDLYKQTPDSITQALLRCQSFSMFLPLGVRHQMAAQCSTSPTPVSYYYAYRIPLTNGQTASTGSPVVASPDNTEPIHVLLLQIDDEGNQVEAGSFDLDPGESADVSVTPGANRQDQILFTALIGDVTVTIGGVTQTVSQGQQITVTTDLTPPAVTLTSASPATTSDSPILVSAVFSEPVAGFDASSLVVTNATVSAFAGSGAAYTFALTPIAPGPVTAAIPGELFTDLAGNVNLASAVFSRTFAVDTTKPVLTLPGSITVDATSVAGAIVSYSASALDDVSGAVAVTCSAASGSTFPIGTTTVTCSAADAAGNVATGSFTVLVRGAAAQVSALIARVQSYHLAQGTENSLVVKLQGVPANAATACSQMGAFINETQAQSGKKLTGAQANQLIAAAQQIKAVLGCP